jgi:fructose-1,6-bisphosphatase I
MSPQQSTDNLFSLQSHILAEEAQHPGASGDFSWIISAISLAGKAIAHRVRRARLESVLGEHGTRNVQGESQQEMDVISNEILMRCLGTRASIAVLASEEDQEPTILRRGKDGGKYCVLFDPLDGSSTLDTNGAVGTIFTVLRNDSEVADAEATVCQPGSRQLAAGYILYGPSTAFVITTGNGVDLFELDPFVGSFILVKRSLRIPELKKVYSVNEAYTDSFPAGYRNYLSWAHSNGYSSRYIGSLVGDIHRILLTGGVFMYPPTKSHPSGKLRLLYEANPIGMIVEQAGGTCLSGTEPTLDIVPTKLHQRVPLIVGSAGEVDAVRAHFRTPADALP